ncbi:hypothetical protein [Streptomyces ossamyceticus]|uniref:Pyrroloquinoline-quinone binding quinoprotein n=1 Tax=Streptomyces ossamyceticus TaxID=249581 RepID=A0ABV2UWY2_9ACTN
MLHHNGDPAERCARTAAGGPTHSAGPKAPARGAGDGETHHDAPAVAPRCTAAARSAPVSAAPVSTATLSAASLAPPLTLLALSLALLTGCTAVDGGAPDGGGKKPAPSGRPTATATAPAYDGPRLPGFAAKPAWSLATGRTAPGVLDLGGTLLFAKDASGAYLKDFDDAKAFLEPDTWSDGGRREAAPQGPNRVLHLSEAPQPLTLEFRDTRTGKLRASLKTATDSVTLTGWRDGAPAVAVGTSRTAGSDGLSAEKTTSTVTVYDGRGRKLGATPATRRPETGLYYAAALSEGYRVDPAGATVRLTPVGGGTARTVTCTEKGADCAYDPRTGLIGAARATAPPVLGGYYAGFENANVGGTDMVRITLSDLATGKKVWSSADAEIPPGVELYDNGDPDLEPMPDSETLSLLRVTDGRVLVAWQASQSDADTWIHAWYDLTSGDLTDSYEATRSVLLAPSGDLAAEDAVPGGTFTGTTVWRLPDGKRLWTQEEGADETPLDPVRFTRDGSVLYGYTTAEDGTEHGLAVDPRTREVLAEDLPVDHVPAVDEATGYGHLSTTDGFHAFAPAG